MEQLKGVQCHLQGGAAVSAAPTKPTKLSSGGAAVSAAPTKLWYIRKEGMAECHALL